MNKFLWIRAVKKSSLPAHARLILHTLATYMDVSGNNCFPSVETLRDDTGLSRATIFKNLKIAAEAGYIKITKADFEGQRWARNAYIMSCPEGCVDVCKTGKCDVEEASEKGSPCGEKQECEGSPCGVQKVVRNLDTTKPLLPNHSNSTSKETITHYVRNSTENPPSEQSCQAEIPSLSDVEKLSVKLSKPERFPPSVASLPPDWQVMALDGFGLDEEAAEREFAKFRAYWTGNGKKDKSGVARKDWKGTWRNWLKTGTKNKFTGGKNEQKRREIKGETYEQKRDRLRAIRAKGIEVSYQDALWLAAVWAHETHGHPAPAPDAIL